MSSMGMLGLLEGLGKGVANTGTMMQHNALLQAEERRKMNLLRIQQQMEDESWKKRNDVEHKQKLDDYGMTRKDLLSDREAGWKHEGEVRSEEKEWDLKKYGMEKADRYALLDYERAHPEPSETDKKIKRADEALAAGKITEAQHTQTVLGLEKSESLTAEDKATLRMKALDQARQEIAGKDSIEGATPEQLKAIDQRAREIYNNALGGEQAAAGGEGSGGQIDQRVIAEDAKTYANIPVEAREGAKLALKRKGYSDADLALLEKNADELDAKKRERDKSSAQNMTKGLISNLPHSGGGPSPGGGTSTMASPGKIIDYGRGLLERSH